MNTICKPEESKVPPVTSVIQSPDGRYTLDNVNTLINNFQQDIVTLPSETTNLARLISTYSSDVVYASNEAINRMLVGIAAPILPSYPAINERISTGVPITPVEYAEFVTEFLYTPFTVQTNTVTDYVRVVSELDDFFTSNFSKNSMGSFCALAPSIFGAIQGFFDVLDSFKDIVSKIQNFSVANLLNQLKEKIKGVIDKVIQKVKNAVENFSVQNVIGRVETFVNVNILSRLDEIRTLALSFFSEENIKNLKDRIEGLINYAISLFKDPSLEEIQYLIYRFCTFISQVENAINLIKNPLDTFTSNYQSAYSVLSSRSGLNTAQAVAAGAIRYNQEQRKTTIAEGRRVETAAGNPPPIESGDIEGVTPWNNGQGDSRITFSGGLRALGEEGWSRVSADVKVRIMQVQREFNRQLTVISAYRSPQLQREIWISTAVQRGLAPNAAAAAALLDNIVATGARNPLSSKVALPGRSAHQRGTALDVTWSGINIQSREEFIRISLAKGFNGIGRYGTSFVHVDTTSNSTWGS
jgi:hypothetical protein